MKFDIPKALEILERTPVILHSILLGLSDEWLMNNEGTNTWSPHDVVGHLIYGEQTDWIIRTRIILSNSENKTFKPFDRFAQMNDGPKKSIKELLVEFKDLREENLRILKSLEIQEEQLLKKGIHPELGDVNLKQLLSAWVVHDLGHIVQISRTMAKQYKSEVGPWTAYLNVLA